MLLVVFAAGASLHQESDRRSDLPMHRNGPPGTFVHIPGWRISLPTDQVVVAAGIHSVPRRPAFASELDPSIRQLHSLEYRNPEQFARDIASAVNTLLDDPRRRRAMAEAARARVERHFSWHSVARQTIDFYTDVLDRRG